MSEGYAVEFIEKLGVVYYKTDDLKLGKSNISLLQNARNNKDFSIYYDYLLETFGSEIVDAKYNSDMEFLQELKKNKLSFDTFPIVNIDTNLEYIIFTSDDSEITKYKSKTTNIINIHLLKDASYDIVVCRFIFIKSNISLIGKIFRLCKPKGKIIIQDHDVQMFRHPLNDIPYIQSIADIYHGDISGIVQKREYSSRETIINEANKYPNKLINATITNDILRFYTLVYQKS